MNLAKGLGMSLQNNGTSVTIVVAEDDEGHARLIEKNLRRAGINNEIKWCENGKITLDYIQGTGNPDADANTSNVLLLLDLNMPVLDGHQVLERLKANDQTRKIPVIVLTTTNDAQEIKHCYEMGCNIYITKPVEYEAFSNAIRQLGLFLNVVSIPNGV